MTLMTSRRRMIIFCPKNDSSPLLSLNRSWFTDPTSLRRSHAFGFPFELVCSVCRLRKFIRQHLSCLVYLVGECRIRIVDNEDGSAEVVYHVHLEFEGLEEPGLEEGRKLLAHLHRILDSNSRRHHVERQERGFFECLSKQDHDGCSEQILLVNSRDKDQDIAASHCQNCIVLDPGVSIYDDVIEIALFAHFL